MTSSLRQFVYIRPPFSLYGKASDSDHLWLSSEHVLAIATFPQYSFAFLSLSFFFASINPLLVLLTLVSDRANTRSETRRGLVSLRWELVWANLLGVNYVVTG